MWFRYVQTDQAADIGTGTIGWAAGRCPDSIRTDLLAQKNPTCDVRTYQGGLMSCHHMWSLLDADQEIPWTDQPLVMQHKWRIYVQPYNESYHKDVFYGMENTYAVGTPLEYDIPKCAEGVAGCSFDTATNTWVHTVTGTVMGKDQPMVSLNFHCHAPACLGMKAYVCKEGVALTDCNETTGELICDQHPVLGGSGDVTTNSSKFDETGYIQIPACLWGDQAQGLPLPVNASNRAVHMIKLSNATYGHTGEMVKLFPPSLPLSLYIYIYHVLIFVLYVLICMCIQAAAQPYYIR